MKKVIDEGMRRFFGGMVFLVITMISCGEKSTKYETGAEDQVKGKEVFKETIDSKSDEEGFTAFPVGLKSGDDLIAYYNKYSEKINHGSAHRGGGFDIGFPENSLESVLELKKRVGNKQLMFSAEMDVRRTKDGQLIMMHDRSLSRTTTGEGAVKDRTWDYISNLNLVDNQGNETRFKVPLFRDLIKKFKKEGIVFFVDIKNLSDTEEIFQIIKEEAYEGYAIPISYSVKAALKMRKLNSTMMLSVSLRNQEEYNRMKESGLDLTRTYVFTGTRKNNPQFAAFIQKQGIPQVGFGTFGKIDNAAINQKGKPFFDLFDEGIDCVSTDAIHVLIEAIE